MKLLSALLLLVLITACGGPLTPEENQRLYKVGTPYKIGDRWYSPKEDPYYDQVGEASWYGPGFHGRTTANGEEFDKYDMTAAHRTLPMPSMVRVTNLENGKSAVLRINDRGPFARGRIIDVSRKAADELGFRMQGMARVRVQFLPEETAALFGGQLPYKPEQYASPHRKAPHQYASLEKRERVEPEPVFAEPVKKPAVKQHVYVKPAPRVYSHVIAAPPQAGGRYVQVGVFRKENNAKQVIADVSRFGVAKMEEIHQEGERFYRVRLGAFASAAEAGRVLNLVQQSGYTDAHFLNF